MNRFARHSAVAVVLCVSLSALVAPASAQTGIVSVLKPWQAETGYVEFDFSSLLMWDVGVDDGTGTDLDVQIHETQARARLDATDPYQLTIAHAATWIHSNATIPSRFEEDHLDQLVTIAGKLFESGEWEVFASFGAGWAGSNPYLDEDAIYFTADVMGRWRIDEKQSLLVGLNYNGNRSIFRDVPLPGVAYQHQVSEFLQYTVGIPFSAIHWRPVDRMTVSVEYTLLTTVDAMVDYELFDGWHVFGAFENRLWAGTINRTPGDRYFITQRRAELGLRWQPCPHAELLVAGGYAFDQQIEFGSDIRDTFGEVEFDSEPYLRLQATLRY